MTEQVLTNDKLLAIARLSLSLVVAEELSESEEETLEIAHGTLCKLMDRRQKRRRRPPSLTRGGRLSRHE